MFGKTEKQNPDKEFFTIYDSKVGSYREPILSTNRFEMIRNLELFLRDPAKQNDPLFVNAEDFQLFKIGEYYLKTATIVAIKPEHVLNVHELKFSLQRSQAPQAPLGIVPT